MPYSDNLYSANDDESETESFSNELSPTDGFFHRSPMASNRMVPDPSLDRKDAAEEDKVLIPRSETRNESGSTSRSATSPTLQHLFPSQNYASSQSDNRIRPAASSTSNTPSSPASRRRTDNELFVDPRDSMQGPPPAYTPSSPPTSSHSNHNRSYSTIEPSQLERGLPTPSNVEPQSMGRPSEDPNERTPLANNEIKKTSRRRTFLRKFLFIALVFAAVVAIMSTLVKWENDTRDPNLPGGKLPDEVKKPDVGLPDGISEPYCASATIKTAPSIYDFGLGEKISLLQETHEGDSGKNLNSVRTFGEIRLRRMPKDSKYRKRGVVSMDTYVSDERLQVLKTWDEDLRTMKVSVPRTSLVNAHDNCISLEITIWLPEDASLSELGIASTMLNVRVFDDIKIKVTGEVGVVSISGDVFFPEPDMDQKVPPTSYPLDSRHITVETVSGNIKGIYPLYDYLKLASQSGDIQAGVFPQPVLPSEPAPANLDISTSSGKIEVRLPIDVPRYTPPARDYVTHVSSISGDIKGGFFLGSVGSLKSTSGDIVANVLPVVQYSPSTDPEDAPKTFFETWSVSGKQDLELLEPVFISLLPSSIPAQPSEPHGPQEPSFSAPNAPSTPDAHHSPALYVPIGDGDPYQDIVAPELNEDVILGDVNAAEMINRRRTRRRTATKKWRTLTATHKTSSSNIKLRYPDAWEGTVTESTISGSTKVIGHELKLISFKKGWPYKELVASKGASKVGEGSSVKMNSISGDLTFAIGEEE
ncbi:hypothetical protein D0Z07_7324 [Hyphodiscus hymeniophilus]|uniref:Adhesin domain-containing protein n=1 Tax=Hyphodiscus hymeniophilus TaxID=353542 RepID=A0A9P6VFU4_9HELO|nr:hypothetical protein D0Z07_7324 [Hyphodiscus hymeniophilus]